MAAGVVAAPRPTPGTSAASAVWLSRKAQASAVQPGCRPFGIEKNHQGAGPGGCRLRRSDQTGLNAQGKSGEPDLPTWMALATRIRKRRDSA